MGSNIMNKAIHYLLIWHLVFERKIEYSQAAALFPECMQIPDAQTAHDEMRKAFFCAEMLPTDQQNMLFALAFTMIETETPDKLANRLEDDEPGMLCALLSETPAAVSPFDAVRDHPKLMADLAGHEKALRAMLLIRLCHEKDFSPSEVTGALTPEREQIFRKNAEEIAYAFSVDEMNSIMDQVKKLPFFKQKTLYHITDTILENETPEQMMERLALPEVFHLFHNALNKFLYGD